MPSSRAHTSSTKVSSPTMDSRPLLGRHGAPSSPKAKYRCKRRPMAKFIGRLRVAMSSLRFVFQNRNTGWADVEFEVKKVPQNVARSMTYPDDRAPRAEPPCFKPEISEQANVMLEKKKDLRARGTNNYPGVPSRRDSFRSSGEKSLSTCDVSDEESHGIKRVRFKDDVEQPTRSNIRGSEQKAFGPISVVQPNFVVLASWQVPFRASLSSLKDGVQSLVMMFSSNDDRRGAFPTADGSFPSFAANTHHLD